jgi:hypothetical protein
MMTGLIPLGHHHLLSTIQVSPTLSSEDEPFDDGSFPLRKIEPSIKNEKKKNLLDIALHPTILTSGTSACFYLRTQDLQ